MRTLAIDCATQACSVALFDGARLVDHRHELIGRGHAERLVPAIAELPDRGRAARIAVSLGPGSFTGVRIGLAAARALALAWGADAVGYPTLALIAAMARRDAVLAGTTPGALAVAMAGGHGEWFVQRFAAADPAGGPVAALAPDAAAAGVTEALVAGSMAQDLVARRGHGTAAPLLPDARAFVLLDPRVYRPADAPIYGRGPDAALPRAGR